MGAPSPKKNQAFSSHSTYNNIIIGSNNGKKQINKQALVAALFNIEKEIETLNFMISKKMKKIRALKKETKTLEKKFQSMEKRALKEYTY